MRPTSITAIRPAGRPTAAARGSASGGSGGLCCVVLDTGRRLRVTIDDVARCGLLEGASLAPEIVARLVARDAYLGARERALRLLAIRPRSADEIRVRLGQQRVPREIARAVIADLTAAGYLDDLAFARFWVTQRRAAHRYGPRRLRWDLRRKGVSAAVADQALSEAVGGDEEARGADERAAAALVQRALAADRRLPPDRRVRRLAALLERRGFTAETIAHTLRTIGVWAPLESSDG